MPTNPLARAVLVKCALLLLGPLLLAAGAGGGDQRPERSSDAVRTKNGRVHTGYVVYEGADRVLLRVGSRTKEFDREDVDRVDSTREALRVMLVHLYDARLGDLLVLKEIATYAESHGLHRTAQLMWWKALLRSPEDEEAQRALGGRLNGGRWELPHEGRWWTFDDLLERTREWDHAWELSSLHFDVRSNLGLHDTIDLILDLEHFYAGFYAFFDGRVELHELLEPMRVEVHADEDSFPKVGWAARSHFDPDQNIAFLNAAQRYERATLLHEASHAIVHNLVLNQTRAHVPAWLDEGFAEYLRAGARGPMGRVRIEPGAWIGTHFAVQKRTVGSCDMTKVLNFGKGDYISGGNPDLKYAQSYTLVDFLLHGPDAEDHDTFFEFVDWCLEGRSSSSHFKKLLPGGKDQLEEAWEDHVDRIAGGASGGRRRIP